MLTATTAQRREKKKRKEKTLQKKRTQKRHTRKPLSAGHRPIGAFALLFFFFFFCHGGSRETHVFLPGVQHLDSVAPSFFFFLFFFCRSRRLYIRSHPPRAPIAPFYGYHSLVGHLRCHQQAVRDPRRVLFLNELCRRPSYHARKASCCFGEVTRYPASKDIGLEFRGQLNATSRHSNVRNARY
jgi:hypothetical protein